MKWKSSERAFLIVMLIILVFSYARIFIEDRNTPRIEYNEKAEVLGRRISSEGGDPQSHYLIAFKFSDGSIKELLIGFNRLARKVYDSFNEGDVGTLNYTEIENIEKKYRKETESWKGRGFISFEKDPEYGGLKLEIDEDLNNREEFISVATNSLIISLLALAGWGFSIYKKKTSS